MNHSQPTPGDLLDYEEAAKILGTAASFVERLVAQRRLAYCKVGHYVRIRRQDLENYVAASRIPAGGEPR